MDQHDHVRSNKGLKTITRIFRDSLKCSCCTPFGSVSFHFVPDAAWSAALFLMILIYFPAKPPTPPCTSAGIQRENFLHGLKHLLRCQLALFILLWGRDGRNNLGLWECLSEPSVFNFSSLLSPTLATKCCQEFPQSKKSSAKFFSNQLIELSTKFLTSVCSVSYT